MRFQSTAFCLFLFCFQLSAQQVGFNRLYADAADCEPTRFEIIDEEYHIFCDCPSGESILVTNLNGLQKSFGLNPFNDCVVEDNTVGSIASYRVDKNEVLSLSQPNSFSIELNRFSGNSCDEVIEQKTIYQFDATQQIQAVDVAASKGSQGGIFIAAYEYLGETSGADPGPHTFRLWMIKTDFLGNELFRYQSPFDIYSLGNQPEMWIDQLSYEGGAMMQFQEVGQTYPHFATVNADGNHTHGGLFSDDISLAINKEEEFSLDGGRYFITYSLGAGHVTPKIQKQTPAVTGAGIHIVGGYGLDGFGVYTITQDGGVISAARGYYDGLQVHRVNGADNGYFSKNYLDLKVPTIIKEAENGEALLTRGQEDGLWILKTCYPDSAPQIDPMDIRINAIIPDPIIPIAGEFFGTLYHPGYSPGEDYIPDAHTLTSWYLSEDDLLDSADSLLSQWEHTALIPFNDNSFPFFQSMTLPEELPTGDFYLLVKNDDSDLWEEENEENNLIAIPFKVYVPSDSTVTATPSIAICAGQLYNDILITSDTVIIDTTTLTDPINYITYDSITVLEITVIENSASTVDLTLESGSIYLSQIITSDTIISQALIDMNGCDSLVTINIQVVTSSQELGSNVWNAKAFPNPSAGTFLLQFTLPQSNQLNFHVLNAQGQRTSLPILNNHFSAGEHQLKLYWQDYEPGIYFIGIEAEGTISWSKLVLIK